MKEFVTIIISILFSMQLSATELTPLTNKLNGTGITYNYTSGRSYSVKFEESGVSYRYLTGSKPEKWWGPFPYQAFEINKNVFFASWFEERYGDYVTLLINLNNNQLFGSAIIAGNEIHFHEATIVTVNHE